MEGVLSDLQWFEAEVRNELLIKAKYLGPEATAEREFAEEMGSAAPTGPTEDLGEVKRSGKSIRLFARVGEFDAESAVSNTFELEWPRGSGRIQQFPEIDRAGWFELDEAERLLAKNQVPFIARLRAIMAP